MEHPLRFEEQFPFYEMLSFEDGLEEIESFYRVQEDTQQRGELPQAQLRFNDEAGKGDEFATLVDDIDQLTGAYHGLAHDVTQPILSTQLENVIGGAEPTNDFTTNVAVTNPLVETPDKSHYVSDRNSSDTAPTLPEQYPMCGEDYGSTGEVSPTKSEGPVNHALAKLPAEQNTVSTMQAHKLSLEPATAEQSSYVDSTSARAGHFDSLPPSSGGRNSLPDEMRSEGQRPLTMRQAMEVNVPKLELAISPPEAGEPAASAQKGGDTDDATEEAEEANSFLDISTELKEAERSKAPEISKSGGTFSIQGAEGKPTAAANLMVNAVGLKVEEASHGDVYTNRGEEALSQTTTITKKRAFAEEPSILNDAGKESKVVKKARMSKRLSLASNAEKATASRLPRNSVGQNELASLTGSTLLSSQAMPQRRSSKRQTRAKLEEEAKTAPNAGRAARERHMKKGAGQ